MSTIHKEFEVIPGRTCGSGFGDAVTEPESRTCGNVSPVFIEEWELLSHVPDTEGM